MHVAGHMTGESPSTLERLVVIELPDIPLVYAYQAAHMQASAHRADLVTPIITSQEQWAG